MSDLEKFQALSNKELHAQILQYGLPNVPVTDSSRNVLIKKLVAAKNAKKIPGASAAAQKRRETLHTTTTTTKDSASSPARPSTSRRRRTVNSNATTHASSEDDADGNVVAVDRAQKSKAATTPAKQYTRRPLGAVPLSKSSVESTSTYDQSYGRPQTRAPSHPRYTRDSDTESVNSNRSSVSLSRSETVTTSFRQEIAPLPRHLEEDDLEYAEDDEEPMDVDDYYMGGNLSGNSSNRTQHLSPLYSDSSELISEPFQPRHFNTNALADSYDLSYESPGGLSKSIPRTTTTHRPYDYTKTNPLTSSTNYKYNNTTTGRSIPTHQTSTKRYTNIGHTTASPEEYDTSPKQAPRRFTTNSQKLPASPSNTLYPSLNDFYPAPTASSSQVYDEDEVDLIDDTDESEVSVADTIERKYSQQRPVGFGGRPIGRRPAVVREHDAVQKSLFLFLQALDKKYSLRQLFAVIVCAVLAIFIYTFFLS